MSKQLTISACSECGDIFPEDDLNHWHLCSDCGLDLEARAEFLAEIHSVDFRQERLDREALRQRANRAILPVANPTK